MVAGLNGVTRNVGSPVTKSFLFTRPAEDPQTIDYTGAGVELRLFNSKNDTAPDIILTRGSGITINSEAADSIAITIVITEAQLVTLLDGATKDVEISYTFRLEPVGYEAIQDDESSDYTGSFTLRPEARAGR